MDEDIGFESVGSGVVLDVTDNELEHLRRLVHDELRQLDDLPKWALITGNGILKKKRPLVAALAEKLGEPDYTKEIY